jgi:GNAT superfamily N-acetyltransferase
MAVVGFSGHFVVASDAPDDWVRHQLPDGDFLAPLGPRFLAALGRRLGRRDDGVDMLLAAPGLSGTASAGEVELADHARVLRAQAHREDVRAFETAEGAATLVLGRGLARRWEVAVEVVPEVRGRGIARDALIDARRLVGSSAVLFAQTAPANAASVRALLAAGFRPVGAEVLFFSGRAPSE